MRLVDVDYALKQLTIGEEEGGKNFETDCEHVRDFLKVLPVIDAVPVRHGRWMDNTFCSCCNWFEEDDKGNILMSFYDFCPCCGAKMDGGADHAVN